MILANERDWITVSAVADSVPRLFSVSVDGRSPTRVVEEYSVDPVCERRQGGRLLGPRRWNDIPTGAERQLTNFPSGFHVRDFDHAPDGREIALRQIQEHSDIVLIEVPER